MIRLSGLTIGQHVTQAQIDAATEKMAQSGFFSGVRYRFTTQGTQLTLVFEVGDVPWTVPVVFDNFVRYSDDVLIRTVSEDVPTFDGTAPAGPAVAELIRQSLATFLRRSQQPGEVDYVAFQDLAGGNRRHIFRIKPGVKYCALHVAGAAAVPERALVDLARDVTAGEYSRRYLADYARQTLIQPYRRAGFWRAEFGPARTQVETSGCDGVSVTLPVTEGSAYAWDHAGWSGNSALTAPQLDALLKFSAGEVASSTKLDDGLRSVVQAYGKIGYVTARAEAEPVFDDQANRVTFQIRVTEGAQFHMGQFVIAGIPASEAESISRRWTLKPGAVYDATYLVGFEAKELHAYLAPPHRVDQKVDAGADHVVNVTLTVK